MSIVRKKSIEQLMRDSDVYNKKVNKLKRELTVKDLTFFGIAAIVGAGSFTSIGQASYQGGPATIFLFLFCTVACIFSAFCYSEFASRLPISGSAYTYAYATFGELSAWVIGWALILEYTLANVYVAFAWGDYLYILLVNLHIYIPSYLNNTYWDASKAASLQMVHSQDYQAWTQAPQWIGIRWIIDIPAIFLVLVISYICHIGIRESKRINNWMVWIKLGILFLVIVIGAQFIHVSNWIPFAPRGVYGIFSGVSAVFFAYIGFDAISTLAEESKNPQRDIPISMMASLFISSIIYIAIALVLTGMVSYTTLGVSDPLSYVFNIVHLPWFSFIIAVAALVALTSAFLTFQIAQPRVWLSMGRDGLFPPAFAYIHPRYQTPSFANMIAACLSVFAIITTGREVIIDFTSLGTIFIFIFVCTGIAFSPPSVKEKGKFRIPFISAKSILLIIFLIFVSSISYIYYIHFHKFYFLELFNGSYINHLHDMNVSNYLFPSPVEKFVSGLFWLLFLFFSFLTFFRKLSLIPILGILSSFYLLTGMTRLNWIMFFAWFLIGLVLYASYGYRKSKLNSSF